MKPNPLFCDHAVLQRDQEVPVWGTASDGEQVEVEFNGQRLSTKAAGGRWMVRLKPMPAGGPFSMTLHGNNTVTLNDILVGDVWICGGQSNMNRPLGLQPPQQPLVNWQQEAASAEYPKIRHFGVRENMALEPLGEVFGKWEVCTPATVPSFTAVGYYFGRDLFKAKGVPIGLLNSSVGGTEVEAWSSRKALQADPDANKELEGFDQKVRDWNPAQAEADYQQQLKLFQEKKDAAKNGGPDPGRPPAKAKNPARNKHNPTLLYNAMIAPLQPYAIRGVIWYQGESNKNNWQQYRRRFPAMITDWRQAWGQGEFPFLFVQLAPFEGMPPEIRESQLLSLKSTKATAMVVITDFGDAKDIHPTQKEPVGARLALAARALSYKESIEYSGPVYESYKVHGSQMVISFSHVGSGLVAKDGDLKGFVIAGADGNFMPAKAEIVGKTVVVSSQSVVQPVSVRFGWTNVPEGNLFNREGLPASPFRTDVTP